MSGAESVDAVVVGSGPNGLTAAAVLADAGWDVLVLEAADEPGGAVRTAELTEPGFRHDLFSAFHPLGAASPPLRALELERHGLRWRHAPQVLAHVLPDDRVAVLSRDPERTADSLDGFARGDGHRWQALHRQFREIRDDLLQALLTPFPPVRAGTRLLRSLGVGGALRSARTLTMPARRFVDEMFDGEGAKLLIAGNAQHTDLGPDQSASAVFGWLLCMLGQDIGFPVPEGGAGSLAAALVRRVESAGGQVRCSQRVERVLVEHGAAVGVRTAGGATVRAKVVLADVPAPTLLLDLVGAEHLPPTVVRDLRRFQWDDATLKVDWALRGPIPWRNRDAAGAGTVHLGVDLNGLATATNDLRCGRVPEHPFLLMGQMTTADPTRSPAGTETAWAYTHLPHDQDWTAEELVRVADRVEAVVERHAPGFKDLVVGRFVAGPPHLESVNPSLVGGSINQGTSGIHQQLVFRPTPGLGRADTVVPGLFLAGASAHPGGGVHGAAGANAARAALASRSWYGPAYRAGVRAALRAITS
ncbi:FAD-dependent oxidoreductase [Actinokineospora bangkokensis]|uniref:Pyridine nucleotide-disulfide oxidoreductase domain-containing protein 2 n=1 Tax=Actinokineospora bangkokensis TaxID=1193682 RepID=A0A1Q9LMX4_9PSEU|nr:FAD-dependent oxidoreductase [Actinokineospora bangkokensis]